MTIAENLAEVRARIAEAARRAGRDPGAVTLVAVSKTFGPDAVREAALAGQTEFGENYVQDARPKIEAMRAEGRPCRWRFVGHLQTNKARDAARLFDVVETVDSLRLAEELGKRARAEGRTLDVLVQVNVGEEPRKAGVAPKDAAALAEGVARVPGLRLRGLMAIHPVSQRPEDARRWFAALRRLRDEAERTAGLALPELSMGMSGDYEIAVEEGATSVRVGTAIFGARRAGA